MLSIYTTTITSAAEKRGILVDIIDEELPIFTLTLHGKSIRCYNALTDMVGAATFHLAQDKRSAHNYLQKYNYTIPHQEKFTTIEQAELFLQKHSSIVVKPTQQWGGRGVSTHITTTVELHDAVRFAQEYSNDLIMEQCVSGDDIRCIFVNYECVTAIKRLPATIYGDGIHTIQHLIEHRNAERISDDPSNVIPLNKETERTVLAQNMTYETILPKDYALVVRRTTNYHTGGTIDILEKDQIPRSLIDVGIKIARDLAIPMLGVDFLYTEQTQSHYIIELSADLAISPPEGYLVAEAFLDMLFPGS